MANVTLGSVPASPKTTRSVSASDNDHRRSFAPVTPQRNNRRSRVASSPLSQTNTSPSIIASPFTPITNVYSSASSVASPNSSISTKIGFSPDYVRSSKAKGIADATNNWRSRAKENGIKVANDEESYGTSLTHVLVALFIGAVIAYAPRVHVQPTSSPHPKVCANIHLLLIRLYPYALFADSIHASFLSTHRRSRQALFQANSSDGTAFITPLTTRITSQGNLMDASISSPDNSSLLNTPESRRSASGSFTVVTPSPRSSQVIAQRLRQRGSLTDPARPRRRQISGPLSVSYSERSRWFRN